MTISRGLTEKEERLLAALLPETTRHRTFPELLGRWRRVVEAVETGYRLGIYDYRNDLTIREIIARILDRINAKLRRKVENMLTPLDERFNQASYVADNAVFPGALARNPDAWWYTRLPRKLVGELKEDSEREGLLALES